MTPTIFVEFFITTFLITATVDIILIEFANIFDYYK